MEFEIHIFFLIGVILCFAGVLQSIMGFAYGLLATPLLVWIGVGLPETMTMVATCSLIQAIFSAKRLNRTIPWKLTFVSSSIRIAGIVIGVFILKSLVFFKPDYIKVVVGGVIFFLSALQFFFAPHPSSNVHWGWAGTAFSVSGLLSGVCGMGGPPLIMWTMAHDWSAQKTRGFMFASIIAVIPFLISLLYLTFGFNIVRYLIVGVIFTPLVYLGTMIGHPLGDKMSKVILRNTALIILMVIGMLSIIRTLFL